MAWFPGAIRKPVARFNAGGDKCVARDHDRGVCLHIAVSEGASLFNYFNQPGNPCSHFYVRYDGDVEQYVDTKYRAPANLQGNPTMISVETMGGTSGLNTVGWTVEQLEALAQLSAWCSKVHPDIPLIPMPSSRPGATGIGYHRLGVDPWRVDGGELWSTSFGKECPGNARIAQIPYIITRARAIEAGDTEAPVTDEEIAKVAAASAKAVWDKMMGTSPASTIMVRLDPGGAGIGAHVRDKVWDKDTTDARTDEPIKTLQLLREAHGDAGRAADTLGEGGAVNTQLDSIHSTLTDEDAQTDRIEAAIADLGLPTGTQAQVIEAVKQALREGTGP